MSQHLSDDEPMAKTLKFSYNENSTIPKKSNNNDNSILELPKCSKNETYKKSEEVEYLETPLKFKHDLKKYRLIKLKNGLKALLISDIHDHSNDNGADDKENKSSCNNATCNNDDKSKCCNKSWENKEKMAACGLSINVGSFSDPPEIPGLAHFLEHMIYLGSEKYPERDDFYAFTKNNSGSNDATTEAELTTFRFHIVEEQLFPALDRFAHCFIAPLISYDTMNREREAIESEFQLNLHADRNRKTQLLCSLAKPGHPVTKFPTGNFVTLRDNVTDDDLYKKLHEFRERHYSAHRMTLAIQARLPLDTLEEYVKTCFSNIPSNNLAADDFSSSKYFKSFDTLNFRRIYKVKSIKNTCQVQLTWALPPMLHHYRMMPLEFLFEYICDTEKGTLGNYLRKKMWCLELYFEQDDNNFKHSSMYELFNFILILTAEGFDHLKEVIEAVFAYIKLICKYNEDNMETIELYDEIKNDADIVNEKSFDYTRSLCENMHLHEPIDYITKGENRAIHDPELIKNSLDALNPENVNIMILNKEFNDELFDKIEPWYKTKYSDEEIPKEWIKSWKEVKIFQEFYISEQCLYKSINYTAFPLDEIEVPQKIYQDNIYELWYKPISGIPICHINFRLMSSLFSMSPKEEAMTDLMQMMLKQLIEEDLCNLYAVGMNYDFQSVKEGLVIKVWGLKDKIFLVLHTIIVKYMAVCGQLLTVGFFQIMKSQLFKTYGNKLLKILNLDLLEILSILKIPNCTIMEKLMAIKSTSFEEFKNFCKSYTKHIYIQGFVQGNISQHNVIKNVLGIFKSLNCRPLMPNMLSSIRILSLPVGALCIRLKHFNPTDTNSFVVNYYQSGIKTDALFAIMELFIKIMEAPLYSKLRAEQQLGYRVSCSLVNSYGVLGFVIIVCTPADRYSTDKVDSSIEMFLEYFHLKLKTMSDSEFENIKKAMIKAKKCSVINRENEVSNNWNEILSGTYIFDRLTLEINEVEKIKLDQIRDWFDIHISGGKNFKKLSIHIFGSNCKDHEQITVDNEQINKVKNGDTSITQNDKLKVKLPDNSFNDCNLKLHYDEYITDIKKFKDKFYAYPVQCYDARYNLRLYNYLI